MMAGNYRQVDSTENFIANSLTHHIQMDKIKPQSTTKNTSPDDDEDEKEITPTLDPFIDINAATINKRTIGGKSILDYASESSSDEDMPTSLANTLEVDYSEDSSEEDVLRHAGIYTVDEIVTISKEKMKRLQKLYTDQFQHLQQVLREKRRIFLIELKKEKETLSSISNQHKNSPKERSLYSNLKAMNHYHRRYGVEALLHKQYLEKRQKQTELVTPIVQQKNIPKCIFSEGGVKCNDRSVTSCKYCRKHIMEDKKQVLYKMCGVEKSGIVCQEPCINVFEDSACILHVQLPENSRKYFKRKYESETESEEELHIETEEEFHEIDIAKDIKVEPTTEVIVT